MTFTIVPIENIDIPYSKLQEQNFDVKRFSAGAIILGFRPDDPSIPHILLCERAPFGTHDARASKEDSCPNTWEGTGGDAEPQDRTLLETMVRETFEEVGLEGWCASSRVYRVTFTHEGDQMAKYICVMGIRQKINCQRLWSDKLQKPFGSDKIPIELNPDENIDYFWATEEQIQNSLPFDHDGRNKEGLVILDSDKDVFLDFFRWLRTCDPDMEYPLPELPSTGVNQRH